MSKNQQRKRFWKKRMHLPTEEVSMGGCVIEAVLWALAIAAMLMALSRSAGGAEAAEQRSRVAEVGGLNSEALNSDTLKREQRAVDWPLICLWGVMLATPVVAWLAVRRQRKNEVELAEAYAGEEVCCSRFSVSGAAADSGKPQILKFEGPLESIAEDDLKDFPQIQGGPQISLSEAPSFPVSESPSLALGEPVKSFVEFPRGVDWTRGASTNAWDDPLSTEPDTLKREQLACEAPRILGAVAEELRLIREMVRAARRSLSVEDYGDLAGSEERLGQVRVTVCELGARLGKEEVPQIQGGPQISFSESPSLLEAKDFLEGLWLPFPWMGSEAEIQERLPAELHAGAWLKRLASEMPERVFMEKTPKGKVWTILPAGYEAPSLPVSESPNAASSAGGVA